MIRHIVCWNINDSVEDKVAAKAKIKELLENLVGVVPGLVEATVITEPCDSCNTQIALYSLMESDEALKIYKDHPAHVDAGKYIRSVVCDRRSLDFEI